MKKNFLILTYVTIGLMFSFSVNAISNTSNQNEFGPCYADPVFEESYNSETIIASNVRSVACMQGSDVLFVLPAQAKFRVIAKTDGWHKIKTEDGKTGWIGSTLIKSQSNQEKISLENKNQAQVKTQERAAIQSQNKAMIKNIIKERVRGRIILAVEKNGEAYYVNSDGIAVYLKDGVSAFEIMRKFGLGISNANLDKLQKGDNVLRDRLAGQIVLAVEKNGEAYYISPRDSKILYLKDGNEAFRIMSQSGLGISNSNLSQLEKKDISAILIKK